MCIIVAKQEGVEFPSEKILENCFKANDDGAGFMYARGKEVHIQKGFMKFEDFMEALHAADIKDYETCVMHFRIGTQGGNIKSNCHPFPIPCDEESVKSQECTAPIGMVHNGIIRLCSNNKSRISDTMIYAIDIVSPLYRMVPSFLQNEEALDLLETTCESKLCFINGLGDLVTVGEFIEDDGILYSNTSYLSKVDRYSSYASVWDAYDSYYGDYDEFGYAARTSLYVPPETMFFSCSSCPDYYGCKECGKICTTASEAYNKVKAWEEELDEEERLYTIE